MAPLNPNIPKNELLAITVTLNGVKDRRLRLFQESLLTSILRCAQNDNPSCHMIIDG